MANEISCLKFEKTWANEHFERHNFRKVSPEYLLKNHAGENEYRTIFDPRSEYEKIDFSNKRGRKIEYTHSIREAVLLVKDGTKMEEIQCAVKKIEDTLEIKCCSIAIHNDEGHVDKDSGKTIYNTHAHLVFYTLDKDGKQNFRLTKIRPKLSQLQQDLADELHMIKPKVNSKHKGLSHAEFREVQEQLEQEKTRQKELDQKQISELKDNNTVLLKENSELKLTLKAQKAQIEEERKKFKEEGQHLAEDYRKLQALNKTLHTQEELDQALAELRADFEKRLKSKNAEIKENTVLFNFSYTVKAEDLKTKKLGFFSEETAQGTADRINAEIRKQIAPIVKHSRAVEEENQTLKAENAELKTENSSLRTQIQNLTEEIKTYFKALLIPHFEKAQDRLKSFSSWVKNLLSADEKETEELKAQILGRAEKHHSPELQEEKRGRGRGRF